MAVPPSLASSKMYDLVVLGAGSGGLEAAYNSAVLHNARVAVVEPQLYHGPPMFSALGGTCVNVGCIPKKLMYYAAEQRMSNDVFKSFGWTSQSESVLDWKALMEKKNALIRDINESYLGMFRDTSNLDLIQGWGVVGSDTQSVRVFENAPGNKATAEQVCHVLKTKNILISTGSWPFKPSFEGSEHTITSNEFFYIPEKPEKVVIVGGGYIAMELLCILQGLGIRETHLVYRGDLPLKGFDKTVRHELLHQLKQREGVTLHLNENVARIEQEEHALKTVTTESGARISGVNCVIMCTGRVPRTSGIGLQDARIHLSDRNGAVVVDKFNRTNVQNVWAVGDVTDRISLTPVAIHEGKCVAESIFGTSLQEVDHAFVPKAVFSIPAVASVGITEEHVMNKKMNVEVYVTDFTPLRFSGLSKSNVAPKAIFKIIVDSAEKVALGVHILEGSAPEIIQSVAVALRMKAKISDFYNTIGLHPSSAEELCSMGKPSYYYVQGERR